MIVLSTLNLRYKVTSRRGIRNYCILKAADLGFECISAIEERIGNSIIQEPIKYKRWPHTCQVPVCTNFRPAITLRSMITFVWDDERCDQRNKQR